MIEIGRIGIIVDGAGLSPSNTLKFLARSTKSHARKQREPKETAN